MPLDFVSRGPARQNPRHRKAIERIAHERMLAFLADFQASHLRAMGQGRGLVDIRERDPLLAGAFSAKTLSEHRLLLSFKSAAGHLYQDLAVCIGQLSYEVHETLPETRLTEDQLALVAAALRTCDAQPPEPILVAEGAPTLVLDPGQVNRYGGWVSALRPVDGDFIDREAGTHHLIELKSSGKLSNKAARSEKEALIMHGYGLRNHYLATRQPDPAVHIFLGVAQGTEVSSAVRQYFEPHEVLDAPAFWGFVSQLADGHALVTRAIDAHSGEIERMRSRLLDEVYPLPGPGLGLSDEDDEEEG